MFNSKDNTFEEAGFGTPIFSHARSFEVDLGWAKNEGKEKSSMILV